MLPLDFKPDDLQSLGHTYLLDLPPLGVMGFKVDMGQPGKWVRDMMPGVLALDLASVIGSLSSDIENCPPDDIQN